ncbi:hypothetical protein Tco_1351561 [Tanacetum coccineum]
MALMIDFINLESSVTLLPYSKKKKKKKSETVTQPKPKSQGPVASGALPQKGKKSKTQTTSLQTSTIPPSEKVPTKDSDKTQSPLPEGTNIKPKDSERNTQHTNMGQPKSLVTDTDTLILITVADIQALLGDSKDELKDVSDEELLVAGEEMMINSFKTFTPYDNYVLVTERVLARNIQGFLKVLYAQVAEYNWEKHEETVASYAGLKWSIDDFHAITFKHYENTDAALRNYQQILNLFKIDDNAPNIYKIFLKNV